MNGSSTRTRIRCAMLRHAEMPKGSRRAPNVYRRVHSRPRHTAQWVGFSSLPATAPWPASCSNRLRPTTLSCNKIFGQSHLITVFPQLFHIGKFFLPTYGLLVSTGCLDRPVDQRSQLRQAGHQSGRRLEPGHSGRAVRHHRRQGSLHRQRLELLLRPSRRHFQLVSTLQAGGVFSGG